MAENMLKELHPLEVKVILAFKDRAELTIQEIMDTTSLEVEPLSDGDIRRAVGWLETKAIIEKLKEEQETFVQLSELGKKYVDKGTPEKQIVEKVRSQVLIIKQIDFLEPQERSEAIGFLKDKGIIEIKSGGAIELKDATAIKEIECIDNLIQKAAVGITLESLIDDEKQIIASRHRERGKDKGIFELTRKITSTYKLSGKGNQLLGLLQGGTLPPALISQLTPDLLKDGKWRTKEFREYNIDLRPPRAVIGKAHPYRQFLNSVRAKLVSMGFAEVTGGLVESEFWNMDALFMPQFHPAREIHGAYFVKSPQYTDEIDPKFAIPVSKTHENGGQTGSIGWRYKYDSQRARRLILRSHGTALSVRTLVLHPEPPGKYFAIARCFRPDLVDATHAPDFFQTEGIVVSEHITFSSLLGLLKMFATEIAGASEVKFKPSYFPFTEPSVELYVKHKKLGWIELGGAGMFRPEVTVPLGVKVPVIAWGLGLERMAMMALNINDIRDLFSKDLEFIRKIV
ncbi:MAG: phenylalanine--tRNA ligase subunit alpha [Candidatus Stahlbacteria bacterium]|nr:phenylalanine--tRNA ligase subunit alpha [Candidatus Stahlbacteria bacterium]